MPGYPEMGFTLTNMLTADNVSIMIGTVAAGLTRVSFDTSGSGIAVALPPAAMLLAGRRTLLLELAFVRSKSPLYSGLMLPREVFQLLFETLGEAALPECLFFQLHGRTFFARPADAHDAPRAIRLCEDFRHFVTDVSGPALPWVRLRTPVRLGMVHLRVAPAGGMARPATTSLTEGDLHAALGRVFPDSVVVLLEARALVVEGLVLTPELLLDTNEQEIPCGLLCPEATRVVFHLKAVTLGRAAD